MNSRPAPNSRYRVYLRTTLLNCRLIYGVKMDTSKLLKFSQPSSWPFYRNQQKQTLSQMVEAIIGNDNHLRKFRSLQSSSPGESHPQALTEPGVSLSTHPALHVPSPKSGLHYSEVPPISGWPISKFRHVTPFAPPPLQRLQHYYEVIRPCAPHRELHPYGSSTWIIPLPSERQVPTFHTKAWIMFTPPLCRPPPKQ